MFNSSNLNKVFVFGVHQTCINSLKNYVSFLTDCIPFSIEVRSIYSGNFNDMDRRERGRDLPYSFFEN